MFKKLKSLFIIEDENNNTKANVQPSGSKSVKKVTSSKPRQVSRPTGGKVNQKFLEVLLDAMDKSNLDGFDYLEFKQFLKSLESVQMEEPTKYRSAFANARTMGATQAMLLDSAQHYLDILRAEESKFEQALAKQRSQNIATKQQKLKSIKETILKKEQQISVLTKEISDHKSSLEKHERQIAQTTEKVERTKVDFIKTYEMLVGQIKKDINNIKTYLK